MDEEELSRQRLTMLRVTPGRRSMLRLFGTGLAAVTLGPLSFAANAPGARRKLGLLIPPTGGTLPGEAAAMFNDELDYLIETLGLESMTPDGYEAVLDRIAPQAEKLAARGAEAILLMGTSLSFYKGQAFNARLTDSLVAATGLPAMTMSTAVIEGLKRVGGSTLAVATAYNDDVNERLRVFLVENGFVVQTVQGLAIEAINDLDAVTPQQLIEFGSSVAAAAPGADTLLVSCGGLPTLEILAPLEAGTGMPAVSSTPHALQAGAKLLGLDGRMPGYGQLLSS
jgi:arylmalonate decarboxylase